MSIDKTLKERNSVYGDFEDNAFVAQRLKNIVRAYWKDKEPQPDKTLYMEALDLICLKISRIVTGDPEYIDNWHDIAGYATIVENKLKTAQALDSVSDDAIYRSLRVEQVESPFVWERAAPDFHNNEGN